MRKIMGTKIEEFDNNGHPSWNVWIDKPIMINGGFWFELNEYLIKEAQRLKVGSFTIYYDPEDAEFWLKTELVRDGMHMKAPDKEEIKLMKKRKEYREIVVKDTGEKVKMYYFVC